MATPAYVTLSEINFWLTGWDRSLALDDDDPNIDLINEVIVGVETEVETVLNPLGYEIPITDTKILAWTKKFLVKELAFIFYTRQTIDKDEIPPTVQFWHNTYSNWLNMLRDQTYSSRKLKQGTLVWKDYPDTENITY